MGQDIVSSLSSQIDSIKKRLQSMHNAFGGERNAHWDEFYLPLRNSVYDLSGRILRLSDA